MADTSPLGKEKDECYDCVIVGAGVAGLVAAHKLQSCGISNFVLVEASQRVGGRLYSSQLGDGTSIELGANWVQGAQVGNPIHDIAIEKLKLEGQEEEHSAVEVRWRDGSESQFLHQIHRFEELEDALERVKEVSLALPVGQDDSLRDALKSCNWSPSTDLDRILEWWACDFEYAESPATTSIHHNVAEEFTQEDFGDEAILITDKRGFAEVANDLRGRVDFGPEDERLWLGCMLTNVEWSEHESSRRVSLTLTTSAQDDVTSRKTIQSRCVLLTVSMGVLQAETIGFSPALPSWKTSLFRQMSMANYIKIFVRWRTNWWNKALSGDNGKDEEEEEDDDSADSSPHCATHVLLVGSDWPLITKLDSCLCFTVVGEQAHRAEKLSPCELETELMDVLKGYFPDSDIPVPEEIRMPYWGSDPLFRGAYSFLPVGSFPDGLGGLQEPVGNGVIWFAGEACHARYSGYLHGAYMSGCEVGERVADHLKSKDTA